MTIINSLHILLCCRENCACRQRCLLLCQGGGEKSRRLQKERGEKRMGSKNNGAHTERLVPYLLPCLEQAIPQPPRCVFFLLLIPLPLLLLLFFLPSSAVFLREQRGLVALAALHSSTSLRLQITHFCRRC